MYVFCFTEILKVSSEIHKVSFLRNVSQFLRVIAPIVVEILFLASLARKRLERIAGLAPKKNYNLKKSVSILMYKSTPSSISFTKINSSAECERNVSPGPSFKD